MFDFIYGGRWEGNRMANLNRPMRNMTARSYSDTTLKQTNNENGIVTINRMYDTMAANVSMHPELSSSAKRVHKKNILREEYAE